MSRANLVSIRIQTVRHSEEEKRKKKNSAIMSNELIIGQRNKETKQMQKLINLSTNDSDRMKLAMHSNNQVGNWTCARPISVFVSNHRAGGAASR